MRRGRMGRTASTQMISTTPEEQEAMRESISKLRVEADSAIQGIRAAEDRERELRELRNLEREEAKLQVEAAQYKREADELEKKEEELRARRTQQENQESAYLTEQKGLLDKLVSEIESDAPRIAQMEAEVKECEARVLEAGG